MPHTVLVTKQADRDLRSLDATTRKRIVVRMEALGDDPFPPGRKKLHGWTPDAWRIRVGEFRVLYKVEQQTVTVLVRNRKDAY